MINIHNFKSVVKELQKVADKQEVEAKKLFDFVYPNCRGCGEYWLGGILAKEERDNYCNKCNSAEVSNVNCNCDDPSCGKRGQEGEVGGHIEGCSCGECHRVMGKLR